MSTERVSSGNWPNAFSHAAQGRESVAHAAEQASFSLLYDEALAWGGDGEMSSETLGESWNDLLSEGKSLATALGAPASQTGTTGRAWESVSQESEGAAGSFSGTRPTHADADASRSAIRGIADAKGTSEVSAPSPPPIPAGPSKGHSGFSKSRLIEWMDKHAHIRSLHLCARFFRRGMEAAGASTADRPASGDAADYGPYLMSHGAQEVPLASYSPQAGDTAVFDKSALHPAGHIEIFDGERWVSDFVQHGFSPYRDEGGTPPFKIYRLS